MKMDCNSEQMNKDIYKLDKEYISSCGLKVRSFTKIMTEEESRKSRERITWEIVRILTEAGKL